WKAPIEPSSALICWSATKHAMPAPSSRASASDSATRSLVRRISIIRPPDAVKRESLSHERPLASRRRGRRPLRHPTLPAPQNPPKWLLPLRAVGQEDRESATFRCETQAQAALAAQPARLYSQEAPSPGGRSP